jgi:NADPH:quinone reductase-like Zn-dependent oxidoreductase
VVATGRAAHGPRALELGADDFVGLDEDGWEEAVGPADLVFDTVGGDVLERSPATVRPGGALVSVVAPPPTGRDDIRTLHFIREQSRPQLVEIARLVDAGEVRPQVGAVYPLSKGREAFTAKSAPGIPGRVILQP